MPNSAWLDARQAAQIPGTMATANQIARLPFDGRDWRTAIDAPAQSVTASSARYTSGLCTSKIIQVQ